MVLSISAETANLVNDIMNKDTISDYFHGLNVDELTPGQRYVYRAWRNNVENHTDTFEVNDLPWTGAIIEEMTDMIGTFNAADVDRIVVTDKSTGLMEAIHNLVAVGCTIAGTATVTRTNSFGDKTTLLGIEFILPYIE